MRVRADHKYGTADTFAPCYEQDMVPHLGDAKAKRGKVEGIFSEERLACQPLTDAYSCQAGQSLQRRR